MEASIEVTLFDKPSGDVRGMVIAMAPVAKKKGKGVKVEEVRIAHATLRTDKSPSVSLSVPAGAALNDLPVISKALADFHAKVEELDASRAPMGEEV